MHFKLPPPDEVLLDTVNIPSVQMPPTLLLTRFTPKLHKIEKNGGETLEGQKIKDYLLTQVTSQTSQIKTVF